MSYDEHRREMKNERAAFRRQGYRDLKSKIKFSRCKKCGAVITHDGDLCHNCLRGMDAYSRKVWNLQNLMCPTCRSVVTGGVTCRRCATIIGRMRRDRMKINPQNWELLSDHIHATKGEHHLYRPPELGGKYERPPPQRFNTNPYKLDNRMNRLNPQLAVPRRVRTRTMALRQNTRGRSLQPPPVRAKVM